jgi:hypothetical protein
VQLVAEAIERRRVAAGAEWRNLLAWAAAAHPNIDGAVHDRVWQATDRCQHHHRECWALLA